MYPQLIYDEDENFDRAVFDLRSQLSPRQASTQTIQVGPVAPNSSNFNTVSIGKIHSFASSLVISPSRLAQFPDGTSDQPLQIQPASTRSI